MIDREFKVRGVYLTDIKQQVRNKLKIGKRIKIKSERDEAFIKVKVVGVYPNIVTVKCKNSTYESFTYWEIYQNLSHA